MREMRYVIFSEETLLVVFNVHEFFISSVHIIPHGTWRLFGPKMYASDDICTVILEKDVSTRM